MTEPTCSIDGCERGGRLARGMCSKHYAAWRREKKRTGEVVPDGRRRERKPCSVEACELPAASLGMCRTHYLRLRRLGTTELPERELRDRYGRVCLIEGCGKPDFALGWCAKHYKRFKTHGSPTARILGEIVDGKRQCSRCRADFPLAEVPRGYCRKCEPARQAEYLLRNPRANDVPKGAATCEVCGAEYLADRRQRFTCSTECKQIRLHRENWRFVQRRRAQLRDVTVEIFSAREIYERDNWTCQLCGLPLDRGARAPDSMSPSIDHAIPLSRGGEHSRANTQAAHLGCNVRKGVRIE